MSSKGRVERKGARVVRGGRSLVVVDGPDTHGVEAVLAQQEADLLHLKSYLLHKAQQTDSIMSFTTTTER